MTARVLLFGDSNTHGTVPLTSFLPRERDRYGPGTRWPGIAAGVLGDRAELIEEGHPGRTTVHDDPVEGAHKNGLTVLPALLETHRPLDLVVIMLGTNDCKARFSVTPTDIARSVGSLIDVVLRSGTGPDGGAPGLLAVAPVPIEERGCLGGIFESGAAKSHGIARALRDVAGEKGVAFFDAGPHATVSGIDGVHLDPAAHGRLGTALGQAIAAALG